MFSSKHSIVWAFVRKQRAYKIRPVSEHLTTAWMSIGANLMQGYRICNDTKIKDKSLCV